MLSDGTKASQSTSRLENAMRLFKNSLLTTALMFFVCLLFVACDDDKSVEPEPEPIVPELTTTAVTTITRSTAESGGTITSDGGFEITARGICWSSSPDPVTSDSSTSVSTDTTCFSCCLQNLEFNTTYYVRAYATSSEGTGYGNTVTFTTLDSAYTVTDIDGNTYHAVSIGTQIWMTENLRVTHYRNGEALWTAYSNEMWMDLVSGASCVYEDNLINEPTYGRLYNWYAVDDSRGLAPEGWHIPSYEEWQTLADYLGGASVAGGKMKETGTTHWDSPNTGATNESGFCGRGHGRRQFYDGAFSTLRTHGYYWTSTDMQWLTDTHAIVVGLFRDYVQLILRDGSSTQRAPVPLEDGYAVRCVKDQP
jgi:uncharacterized protein (TIGR02145 family)